MNYKRIVWQVFLGIIYLLLISFFIFECLKDGDASFESSSRISKLIASFIEFFTHKEFVITESFDYWIRKLIGHFGYFYLLGIVSILFYLSFSREIKSLYFLTFVHYITGFLFAFVTEFLLQELTLGRSASFKDVMIDYCGFISFSGFIYFVYFFKKTDCKIAKNILI